MKKDCFKSCFCAKGAFTLIELLVVVLIIGILAAVALPQYQVAVEKSRVMQVLSAMKAIETAQKVYHLANGDYTPNMKELDVEVAAIPGWNLTLETKEKIVAYRGDDLYRVVWYYDGNRYIFTKNRDLNSLPAKVCKNFGKIEDVGDRIICRLKKF